MQLSLPQALDIAKEKSLIYRRIKADFKSARYSYESFMGTLKPQISINGVLPSYDSRLDNVIQPDGSYKVQSFRRSNIFTSLSVEQNILWTGGTLFVSSGLNQFVNDQPYFQRQYQASPFVIGIRQPLSLFNTFRWNYQEIKLKIAYAIKKQIEDIESLNLQITSAYFDLYVATMELKNAIQNEIINDTLLRISTDGYNFGKIAEDELLQVKLQLMNAQIDAAQSQLLVKTATKRLINLLGIDGDPSVELLPVIHMPVLDVDLKTAVREANENRSDLVEFRQRENDAKMQVKQSQSRKYASGEIFVSYGLNQTGTTLSGSYKNPLNSQQINIGYSMPLVGWGKHKNDLAAYRQNLEAVQAQLSFDKSAFDLEVENAVDQFKQLQTAMPIAAQSDTIARRRFEIAKDRYLAGKINITSLGLAQDAKDKALIKSIRALQQYWVAYYQLRKATLFDFATNTKILAEEAGETAAMK